MSEKLTWLGNLPSYSCYIFSCFFVFKMKSCSFNFYYKNFLWMREKGVRGEKIGLTPAKEKKRRVSYISFL